ncbi:hypothetical protein [Streptomyces chumphonensis]|uniref:hypothetical protein n=1 Tax=Streptomyces chumphonensis TaxID=1214925 RepID=UPI003D755615
MGIESEKLVFDYLSRVGDVAHRTTMTAAERARLVGELRAGIERMRAEGSVESVAEVRRILGRFGKPEDVVAAARGGGGVPMPRPAEKPAESGDRPSSARAARRRRAPRAEPPAPTGPTPPHLVGMDELPPEAADPQWWNGDGGPFGKTSGGHVDGFVGGIEIPEMLVPPTADGDAPKLVPGQALPGEAPPGRVPLGKEPSTPEGGAPAAPPEPAGAEEPAPSDGRWARLRRLARVPVPVGGAGVARVGGPVELLAVAALVAGTVFGSLLALAAGWLVAWWSPRLPLAERKWAVLGMPALVAGGGAVWLWGRATGRWGEPVPEGALGDVLQENYPWFVRAAALASAVFLLWRARRVQG